MRKRLILGAIAVVVIGVAAYMLSQPRKGTVEYHKREYLEAMRWGRWEQWFIDNGPDRLATRYERRKIAAFELHRKALLDLGYWNRREVRLSNEITTRSEQMRFWQVQRLFTNDPLKGEAIASVRSTSIVVIGLSENMPKWENEIRKLDVPETK